VFESLDSLDGRHVATLKLNLRDLDGRTMMDFYHISKHKHCNKRMIARVGKYLM